MTYDPEGPTETKSLLNSLFYPILTTNTSKSNQKPPRLLPKSQCLIINTQYFPTYCGESIRKHLCVIFLVNADT